jgi:hypothetical protein
MGATRLEFSGEKLNLNLVVVPTCVIDDEIWTPQGTTRENGANQTQTTILTFHFLLLLHFLYSSILSLIRSFFRLAFIGDEEDV